MTLKTVIYDNCSLLPCIGCGPSEVIICIDPDLIAPTACPAPTGSVVVTPAEQTVEKTFIEGRILSVIQVPGACGQTVYRYLLQYDDVQLVPGGATIPCSKINGIFCKDCKTSWVEYLAGLPISVQENTPDVISITNQYGCTFSFPVGGAQTPITPVDTNSVNLTVSGVDNHTIQADVIISPDVGNSLETRINGLYVPDVTSTPEFIDLGVTAGSDIAYTIPGAQTPPGYSLAVPQLFTMRVHVTNGVAPVTLDVNGTGAKPLQLVDGSPLVANELQISSLLLVNYNPTLDRYSVIKYLGNQLVTTLTLSGNNGSSITPDQVVFVYTIDDKFVEFNVQHSFTIVLPNPTLLSLGPLPVTPTAVFTQASIDLIDGGGAGSSAVARISSATNALEIQRFSRGTIGSGANASMSVSGRYRIRA